MFSFHIGLPGLHENVLRSAVPDTNKPESTLHLVSNEDYTAHLAPYVNTRDKEKSNRGGYREAAVGFISNLQQYRRVVFTQPMMLGTSKDALTHPEPFPLSGGRISRISKLLHDQELEFHLLLTNQTDYFSSSSIGLDFNDRESVTRAGVSWHLLVERLRNAAPNAEFFVWDFERPAVMAPALQTRLLGMDLMNRVDQSEAISAAHGFKLPSQTNPDVAEMIDWLDEKYEEDLENLEKMANITLIHSVL